MGRGAGGAAGRVRGAVVVGVGAGGAASPTTRRCPRRGGRSARPRTESVLFCGCKHGLSAQSTRPRRDEFEFLAPGSVFGVPIDISHGRARGRDSPGPLHGRGPMCKSQATSIARRSTEAQTPLKRLSNRAKQRNRPKYIAVLHANERLCCADAHGRSCKRVTS